MGQDTEGDTSLGLEGEAGEEMGGEMISFREMERTAGREIDGILLSCRHDEPSGDIEMSKSSGERAQGDVGAGLTGETGKANEGADVCSGEDKESAGDVRRSIGRSLIAVLSPVLYASSLDTMGSAVVMGATGRGTDAVCDSRSSRRSPRGRARSETVKEVERGKNSSISPSVPNPSPSPSSASPSPSS